MNEAYCLPGSELGAGDSEKRPSPQGARFFDTGDAKSGQRSKWPGFIGGLLDMQTPRSHPDPWNLNLPFGESHAGQSGEPALGQPFRP